MFKTFYELANDYNVYIMIFAAIIILAIAIINKYTDKFSSKKEISENRSNVLAGLFFFSTAIMFILMFTFYSYADGGYYKDHTIGHMGLITYSTIKAIPGFLIGITLMITVLFINEVRIMIRCKKYKKNGKNKK